MTQESEYPLETELEGTDDAVKDETRNEEVEMPDICQECWTNPECWPRIRAYLLLKINERRRRNLEELNNDE